MGVSIEQWRMCIGGFNFRGSVGIMQTILLPMSSIISSLHLFLLLFVLLLIGNIELNPGPVHLSPCCTCGFQAISAEQHLSHQKIHDNIFNYQFTCPFLGCTLSYSSLRNMSNHISKHEVPRNEVTSETVKYNCEYCVMQVTSNRDYCQHLKIKHLDKEAPESIICPLILGSEGKCEVSFEESKKFSLHLSRCHPGWRDDYSTSALTAGEHVPVPEAHQYIPAEPFDDAHGSENPGENPGNDDEPGVPDNDSCSTASSKADEDGVYDYDQIVEYIAHFYAMLEGKYIVPSSTVNALASKLSFLTEIVQDKLRRDLTKSLTSVGLSADVITNVIRSVVSMDPLYNCHHKNAPGECFLTKALRQTYYKNHFKYQEPVQINLRRDPKNTEDTIQYVDIKESLRLMLEDPSVQKVVDRSFNIPPSDGSVYANYTDGSVYRESGTPQKRIDILLYMDAYNCANPLGSAKNKHKTNGMNMTLGNLDPYMRAFLKAMRLVIVLNEKAIKKTDDRYRKCFEALLKDLKILERDGFLYKEERIDVRVQFFQGDNLGQNGIGGFVESFSASHYCRFCDLSKIDYKTDCKLDIPQFPVGNWRTPESFNRDLRTKLNSNVDHEAGVKRNSPFNQLDHFHVCDPRLPPCLGHDLFIDGVVDCDLASIIRGMIGKGWFTEEGLNMRIRGFKYKGRDARNKPAPFKMTKKKLGGHAIQNWTLCRLLPFLIGDWVKTDHKLWKLYLLLKRTIELVCAPALTADQVELMGVRIKKYMKKRKILPNKYKPKHHFFSHYKDLFLKFGPLIHMWTMAFEHRHQYFKRVSQICRNFINLNKLLARKFQLLMAYQSMGQLFPDRPVFSNTSPLEYENENQELKDFLMSLNLPEESEVVESLVLNDIKHKPGEFLFLSATGGDIILGQVEMIIFDGNTCRVVVEKYKTSWWQEYSIYYVQESIGFGVVLFEELENPCPHSIYEFMEYSCFSLRHDMKD